MYVKVVKITSRMKPLFEYVHDGGITWPAERPLPREEGLCPVELITYFLLSVSFA
jgi:hypothetical protein